MGCRSSRLGHDSSGGLRLWVHRKAVNQLGHGWWRLQFDDIRCKRMISRGLQVVGAAHSTLDWNDTDQLDLRKAGFNRFYHNRNLTSIICKELQDVHVEWLFSPSIRIQEPVFRDKPGRSRVRPSF